MKCLLISLNTILLSFLPICSAYATRWDDADYGTHGAGSGGLTLGGIILLLIFLSGNGGALIKMYLYFGAFFGAIFLFAYILKTIGII